MTVAALMAVHMDEALVEVAKEVFPHWALDIQITWMCCGIHKPSTIKFQRLDLAVVRVNNSLPLFQEALTQINYSNTKFWRS